MPFPSAQSCRMCPGSSGRPASPRRARLRGGPPTRLGRDSCGMPTPTPPARPRSAPLQPVRDSAHVRRVVLELVLARLVRVELVDHDDVAVAAGGNAVLHADLWTLARSFQCRSLLPSPRHSPESPVRGWAWHHDAGSRLPQPGQPERRLDDPLVVVLLRVLAEVPDRSEVVLGVEGQLDLLRRPFRDVPVPRHHRPDAVDRLGHIGHRELDSARHAFRRRRRRGPSRGIGCPGSSESTGW